MKLCWELTCRRCHVRDLVINNKQFFVVLKRCISIYLLLVLHEYRYLRAKTQFRSDIITQFISGKYILCHVSFDIYPTSQKTRSKLLLIFANCWLIFKILSLTDSAVHLQQSDDKDLTKSQTRRYITLWNLSVQKLIQLVNTVVKMSFWAVYAAHF